jgi:hypothetical protein
MTMWAGRKLLVQKASCLENRNFGSLICNLCISFLILKILFQIRKCVLSESSCYNQAKSFLIF